MQVAGIGTNIVECLRIARLIERHGELFINRVYTPHEIDYCSERLAATQHYAAHWAAKEAVLKALAGYGRGTNVRDIEIRTDRDGSHSVVTRGAVRDAVRRSEIRRFHVSMSHCRTHAVAYVIAEGEA